jgi:hypothetical protein
MILTERKTSRRSGFLTSHEAVADHVRLIGGSLPKAANAPRDDEDACARCIVFKELFK